MKSHGGCFWQCIVANREYFVGKLKNILSKFFHRFLHPFHDYFIQDIKLQVKIVNACFNSWLYFFMSGFPVKRKDHRNVTIFLINSSRWFV